MRRPAIRASRAHAELVALDADRSSRRDRFLPQAHGDRAGRDRARSAAGRRASPTGCATLGVAVFGPSAAAAQLEGSKGFTKDLCARAGIPTAALCPLHRLPTARRRRSKAFGMPVVIKADGLAAGKGVIIAETRAEAEAAIDEMFDGGFGGAGAEVVIEEFMTGEEASFFALVDGTNVIPFGSAQDHKRVGDGDTGPNTGGMGAYSPGAGADRPNSKRGRWTRSSARPSRRRWPRRARPIRACSIAGLMLTDEGPKLIEYNARFGDPECQVLMMRLEGDLARAAACRATGGWPKRRPPAFAHRLRADVVMAANGYPGTPKKAARSTASPTPRPAACAVFHAGTRAQRRRSSSPRRPRARRHRARPDGRRGAGTPPIARSTSSISRAASAAATSAGAKSHARPDNLFPISTGLDAPCPAE